MSKSKGNVSSKLFFNWSEKGINEDIRYHHFLAKTPFGRFVIITYNKNDVIYYDLLEAPWGDNSEFYGEQWYINFMKLTTIEDMKMYLEKEYRKRIDDSNKLFSSNSKNITKEQTKENEK